MYAALQNGADFLRASKKPRAMYEALKLLHVSTVVLTILGFVLRGYWMFRTPALLGRRLVKVAPHVVDTLLLASGIGLIVVLHLEVLDQDWLLAKLAALVVYIVLGAIALGRGKTMRARTAAFIASLAIFVYIVGVALSKSTYSWLTYLRT